MADMQQEKNDLQVCVRNLQEKMEVINQVSSFRLLIVLTFEETFQLWRCVRSCTQHCHFQS